MTKKKCTSYEDILTLGILHTLYHKVVPIFYNVTTDNVKYLTEEFGSNLGRHQSPHEQNKIGKWKEALACISCKLGFPFIDNNGY